MRNLCYWLYSGCFQLMSAVIAYCKKRKWFSVIFEINWNQHRVLTCFERWIISGISAHVQLKFFLIIAFKFYINIKSKIAYSISWISWQKIVGKKTKKKMGKVIPSERKKAQQDFGVNTLFLFSWMSIRWSKVKLMKARKFSIHLHINDSWQHFRQDSIKGKAF